MNEKLSYAEMLDIPYTSSVTVKRAKPRRHFGKKKVSVDEIKETLIEKINSEEKTDEQNSPVLETPETPSEEHQESSPTVIMSNENTESEASSVSYKKPKKAKKKRVIGIQLAVIGVLSLGIFLTNALIPGSGINLFLNEVFGSNSQTVDLREYTDFTPEIPTAMKGVYLDGGVVGVSEKSSVYSFVNGVVEEVTRDAIGKYSVKVMHSENFSTVITGLDYCYAEKGGKVLKNVPVGYCKSGGAKLCFYDQFDAVIVNFTLSDNQVLWAV